MNNLNYCTRIDIDAEHVESGDLPQFDAGWNVGTKERPLYVLNENPYGMWQVVLGFRQDGTAFLDIVREKDNDVVLSRFNEMKEYNRAWLKPSCVHSWNEDHRIWARNFIFNDLNDWYWPIYIYGEEETYKPFEIGRAEFDKLVDGFDILYEPEFHRFMVRLERFYANRERQAAVDFLNDLSYKYGYNWAVVNC